ncbi:23S rRNA (uracil(1939)-C(5))-methyltransferase RlmD [uncultured Intestinimonas sp.]|uniref:23S rRNA (uracil(1939)-C(5))-methyltransferase RlmD n=1 Tax=uncultured Intestinimonas sp. TaxID=1689265 RepID=UPI0025D75331|nr:23S rRNA (uracil(1939)-C(5))-methyltransferase RlmD [uncultured Intestinimonas sp.]
MPRKNDVLPLTIESIGLNGEGIAHLEGQVVFVPGGLPGEVCDVQILKVGRSAIWGKVLRVPVPSPDRAAPDCPSYPKCGGCQFRHMTYAAELEAKRRRVEDAFRRIGGLDLAVPVILGAKNTERYRNKVQLPIAPGPERPKIGFFRARSHDVVDVADCLLQPETASALAGALRAWMGACHVPAYEEGAHRGLLRHLFLRFSQTGVLCCLVVNGEALPHEGALVEALRAAAPQLTGVVLSVNRERTNVVLGQTYRTLWGEDFLDDTLCGLTFRISVPSFFQVNREQCEVLYQKAVELSGLTGRETVLDLYCGIGTISLVMARQAGRVVGAEIVPAAVEDARANARRNGIDNAGFFCGDAAEAARRFAAEGLRPDVVCVDPPRKGLAPEVIASVVQMAPERVVYVSCDPATLARDLSRFAAQGYRPKQALAVDMFPRTAHVETVVLLSKGEVDSKKIRVEFSLEDMDMSEFQDGATYPQIKAYVLEHSGLKVSNLYISQIKRKCGIEVGKNYNLPKSEDSRQPQCPPEKEKAIREAFKYFGMI